jgi:hypothetical protein
MIKLRDITANGNTKIGNVKEKKTEERMQNSIVEFFNYEEFQIFPLPLSLSLSPH